jgi:hypothetical protein
MISLANWLPPLVVGLMLTIVGCLKLWGLKKGIVAGADKPLAQRLCGT